MPSRARAGLHSLRRGLARTGARAVRQALLRYIRTPPRGRPEENGRANVTILLGSAWGMGGTIRSALNLAGYLAARHDVEIISVVRRRNKPFFAFPPGVKVTALDDRRRKPAPIGLRLLRRVLRSRSSALMPPRTRPFAVCSLWTDVQLARRLRGRSGILIGTHASLNLLAADLSLPGVIAVGQEQMYLEAHREDVRAEIAGRYPRLDALVVLTDQDADAFSRFVPDPINVSVIPNAVRALGGDRAPLTGTTILAAGRLAPQKGFDLLIQAFARVAAAHPDWRLLICGRGQQKRDLRLLADALQLTDVVSLPGPARHLGEEMERAAVFALSSRSEGFPLILVEAMSKGLPVVSFDCRTGPRDIIEDHRNGLLVPAEDVDALAEGMLELVADEELRRRLGAEAARTAGDYTVDALGARWDALLDQLLRSRRGASAP